MKISQTTHYKKKIKKNHKPHKYPVDASIINKANALMLNA
jgi:hypothetical protein